MSNKKWLKLMDQGAQLLQEKDFLGAEQAFFEALALEDNLSTRNNLALAILLGGNAARALTVLKPYIAAEQPPGNPFSFALLSQIYSALVRKKEGKRHLDTAITLFEQGQARLEEMGADKKSWHEYTVAIMKGAAALGEHRLVCELYRRWESCHVSWENRYLAGIASFNLGRYGRAASLWGSLAETGPFAVHMQKIAFLAARGLVPPFPLEYEQIDPDALRRMAREAAPEEKEELLTLFASSGAVRMSALTSLFGEGVPEKEMKALLELLIRFSGDWGENFGLRLLEAGGVPRRFKLGAAYALLQSGVFKPGEPIPVVIDGKAELFQFSEQGLYHLPNPELDRLVEWAGELIERGRPEDATALLEPPFEQGILYPPLMITLANLYRALKKPDRKQRAVLKALEKVLPGHPEVLYNLAVYCMDSFEYHRALEYLDYLGATRLDGEMEDKVEGLRRLAKSMSRMQDAETEDEPGGTASMEDPYRLAVERKALPVQATLARGLKNMPNEWLEGFYVVYVLDFVRLRREREEQVIACLTNRPRLERILRQLKEQERVLLEFLLEQGGWARLQTVTRRFGTMEGDGYYWNEFEPRSTLGRLWSWALVMVGRARLDGSSVKVAVIPSDLRGNMAHLLSLVHTEGQDQNVELD